MATTNQHRHHRHHHRPMINILVQGNGRRQLSFVAHMHVAMQPGVLEEAGKVVVVVVVVVVLLLQ